ncbi:formimidoylglutamase [Garicola koreensis]|uniref:formimidoylglutamase n=1 Tax=Garicola koreensis TaxID=1262554 RepID=UPI0031EFD54A
MTAQPRPNLWTGRHDGTGAEHARWHEVVRTQQQRRAESTGTAGGEQAGGEQVSLLGFSTDEGVRRNGGRVGAAQGPAALRRALAPLALHGPLASGEVRIRDYGDVVTEGEDLEAGQTAAAEATAAVLDAAGSQLSVVLGGGHETAWSSYRGLMASQHMQAGGDGRTPRWGVLNLDAHFDLRSESRPTSGTPFLQMADAERAAGRESLAYAVLGLAEPSNTGALFAQARSLGVRWMTDAECAEAGAAGVRRFVEEFCADLEVLYLTIDLDLLPADVAPGVSAPASMGVATPLVAAAVRAAAATGKLRLLDVVELNPSLDQDQRTAKTAARLIDEGVRTLFHDRAQFHGRA